MHLDAVPGREPADHEQSEPVAVEQVERLGLLDAPVGLGERLRAHAEPPVLDLDHVAVADRLAGDPHPGVGRRELGGVLDDLRQEVREVGHRGTDHGRLGELPYLHARVVLDFGDGRADHVRQ